MVPILGCLSIVEDAVWYSSSSIAILSRALQNFGFPQVQEESSGAWIDGQMILFVLQVDYGCISGPKHLVLKTVKEVTQLLDYKDLGEIKDYAGCKVERRTNWICLTQPVKVQRFIDEFKCTGDNGSSHRAPTTPTEPGSVFEYDKDKEPGLNQQSTIKVLIGRWDCIADDEMQSARHFECCQGASKPHEAIQ